MIINSTNLKTLFTGFQTLFNRGIEGAPSHWRDVAMAVTSTTRVEDYGWLGELPRIREWLGDRVIGNLRVQTYNVKNRKFEATVAVPRDDVADDREGLFAPLIENMGRDAAMHPDELLFDLLAAGFDASKGLAYDGQFFFDTDHPVIDENGIEVSVSNVQAGANPAWFLLDTSRPIRPMLFQTRENYDIQRIDQPNDEHVFKTDEFLYGVRGRANAGFGLWQMAFGSKADLDADNFALAKAAMSAQKGDGGRRLAIMPNVLVTGPANEQKARQLLKGGSRVIDTGDVTTTRVAVSNEWQDAVELIVTPFID